MATTTLGEFLDAAWGEHGDGSAAVAERLAASLHLVGRSEDVAPFAALTTHVFGEHLGRWSDGVALLGALRERAASVGNGAAQPLLERSVAMLRHAGGEAGALDALANDDRVCALALAASAFAGRSEFKRAARALAEALDLAGEGLPETSPALRALAIAGNNIAAGLEEKADRDEAETRAMLAAAECGLTYWHRAGTWLEEERALRRLAYSRLQAGNAEAALQSALAAVAVCSANAAPPGERFASALVVALAQRARGDRAAFEPARDRALAFLPGLEDSTLAAYAAQVRELRT